MYVCTVCVSVGVCVCVRACVCVCAYVCVWECECFGQRPSVLLFISFFFSRHSKLCEIKCKQTPSLEIHSNRVLGTEVIRF